MNTENTIETSDITTTPAVESSVTPENPVKTKTRKGTKGKGKSKVKATPKAKGRPGRPAAPVKLIMTKAFTLKDLQALNPDVKFITLNVRVRREIKNGTLTRLAKGVKSGKRGRPMSRFINARIHAANIARKAKSEVVVDEVDANVEPSVV